MISSTVTPEVVSFASDGVALRGELFLPDDAHGPAELPAVVVTGTWTSVRQQMADRYARAMAARGFAALSFDFTGFGCSDGEPRDVESAALKARDIHNAVRFLVGHQRVAAVDDPRIRALALIAPWMHDPALVRETYGGEQGVGERIAAGEAARDHYARTGTIDYVPAQSASDPAAAMPMAMDFYENPNRGGITEWHNRFAVMAWPEWLTLDSIALAPRLRIPTLLVHSEDAAIPDGARRFHAPLGVDKTIAWTTGTQFDFYDQQLVVSDAADRAAAHFARLS